MTDTWIIVQTIRAIVSLSDHPLERLKRLASEHESSIFRSPSAELNASNQDLYFISEDFCKAYEMVWIEYGGNPNDMPKLSNLIGNSGRERSSEA